MSLSSVRTLFIRPEFGLLIIRATLGLTLLYFGLAKFLGGQPVLIQIGKSIEVIGISAPDSTPMPLFFGIMAALTEMIGGLLMTLGLFFRSTTALLIFVMTVATISKYAQTGGDFSLWAHPFTYTLVLLGLLFTGPGQLSMQRD